MSTWTNERGNTVESDSAFGSDRYKWDFDRKWRAAGWKQYDTDQDASYFGVWVNVGTRQTFTFAEGDTSLVTCPTLESFRAELAHMAEFYGNPPPACTAIGLDGSVEEFYDTRPGPDAQPQPSALERALGSE